LYEDTVNNDHLFSGFGLNAFVLRYQTGSTSTNHVFYAGASLTTSNELMRINGDGKVGIGLSPDQLLSVKEARQWDYQRSDSTPLIYALIKEIHEKIQHNKNNKI
jgi:hypothetical protein